MGYEGFDAFVWPPASDAALASDALAAQLAWSGVAFVALLVIGLAVAVARPWRARWPLFSWAAGLVACLAPFAWHGTHRAERGVRDAKAYTVRVHAYRYRWEFESPSGLTDGELLVPAGRPIRLLITSESNGEGFPAVIHGFSVPGLRVQADVIPGRVTELWFEAAEPGEHQIYCDDFCGTGHSRMLSTLRALSEEDMSRPGCTLGLVPPDGLGMVEWGEQLFQSHGCGACHQVSPDEERTRSWGPPLTNVAGYPRPLADGRTVLAKTDYLRRAIAFPDEEIAKGWDHVRMPAFLLPQLQLDALVAYLASLNDRGAPAMPPDQGR